MMSTERLVQIDLGSDCCGYGWVRATSLLAVVVGDRRCMSRAAGLGVVLPFHGRTDSLVKMRTRQINVSLSRLHHVVSTVTRGVAGVNVYPASVSAVYVHPI